ncbi:hypothetical protein ACQE9L_28240, partial [Klebsiella pneumoniae]
GTVCVVGKIRDLILQLSKSSIYSTKPPLTPRTKNRHKKTSRKRLVYLGFLVGTRGFEPPTPDTP